MKIHLQRHTRKVRLKNRKKLIQAINLAGSEAGFDHEKWVDAGLDIVFMGSRQMRRINREFLQHDYITDVITFDLREDDRTISQGSLGEILVCPVVAVENAGRFGTPSEQELMLYIVHGILHLSGLDDQLEEEKAVMRKAETRVMQAVLKQFDCSEIIELND